LGFELFGLVKSMQGERNISRVENKFPLSFFLRPNKNGIFPCFGNITENFDCGNLENLTNISSYIFGPKCLIVCIHFSFPSQPRIFFSVQNLKSPKEGTVRVKTCEIKIEFQNQNPN
jgi:hypothetical protein